MLLVETRKFNAVIDSKPFFDHEDNEDIGVTKFLLLKSGKKDFRFSFRFIKSNRTI